MNESNQDRIDRFLRGEMSSKESLYFEQEALDNSELRHDVEVTYRVKRRLGDRKNKLRTTAHWEHKRRNNIIKFSSISSIAAAVVIGFFFWNHNPDVEVTNSSLVASNSVSDVETTKDMTSRMTAVRNSVEQGHEEEAIASINEMEEAHQILSVNNNADRQQMTFSNETPSESDVKSIDSYECHWIKINALIKTGQYAEAIDCLEKFVLIEGKYKDRADSLLLNLKQK